MGGNLAMHNHTMVIRDLVNEPRTRQLLMKDQAE